MSEKKPLDERFVDDTAGTEFPDNLPHYSDKSSKKENEDTKKRGREGWLVALLRLIFLRAFLY
ncbi:MAG: hypothetical protein WCX88_04205 [Patescibacteria group bacterium]